MAAPKLGKIDAEAFIDEVSNGATLPIAHWVLEKAAQLAINQQQGIEVPVSINLFGKELLQDEFIDHFTMFCHPIHCKMAICD